MSRFAEIQGTLVPDRKPIAAGEFAYYYNADGSGPVGLRYVCPCGCGLLGIIPIRPAPKTLDSWEWDQNMERPTLSPSINHQVGDGKGGMVEHWHGHLIKGFFKSV